MMKAEELRNIISDVIDRFGVDLLNVKGSIDAADYVNDLTVKIEEYIQQNTLNHDKVMEVLEDFEHEDYEGYISQSKILELATAITTKI